MRGNFLVLTLGVSFWWVFGKIFLPYESPYMSALGAEDPIIGAYFAVNGLVGATVGILGGYICDTRGRRKIVVSGNYATALLWFVVALAPNWQAYFAAKVLLSIVAFWTVAETVILMDTMPARKRGLGYGVFNTMWNLASLASPAIGGLIFDEYNVAGMRLVLLSISAADAVKAVLYTRWLRETLEPKGEKKSVVLSLEGALRLTARLFVEAYRTLKWLPLSLLAMCVLNVLYAFAWSLVGPFMALYAMRDVILLTGAQWGLISTIQIGISLFLRFLGGRLVDRYGKRRALLVSLLVDVPFFLAFIYSRSYLQVLAAFAFSTIVGTLTETAWRALQIDLTPQEKRGKVSSLFGILGGFSGFFGALLGGYLYYLGPALALPFWLYVYIAVFGVAIAFMFIREPEKPEIACLDSLGAVGVDKG